jgi:hypothetical protein
MEDLPDSLFFQLLLCAFALVLAVNILQTVVFHRQHAPRAVRPPVNVSHVPTRRVLRAQSAFYVCILGSSSSFFVMFLSIVRGVRRTPLGASTICTGTALWLLSSVWRIIGYASDTAIILLLDFIYAATLDELGLTGRSRQLKRERRIRDVSRTSVALLLLLSSLLMTHDTAAAYAGFTEQQRDSGCLPFTRELLFSTFTLHTYSTVILLSWVYLSLSLLLLLGRNARVAREARKRHLPSYELYRAALGRIRIIIYTNLTALGAIYAALGIIGPLETNLIYVPTNMARIIYYVMYAVYGFANGFAFLHRRSNASARLIKVTSPMMAAMESTFTPSAPVNDAVGSPSCL